MAELTKEGEREAAHGQGQVPGTISGTAVHADIIDEMQNQINGLQSSEGACLPACMFACLSTLLPPTLFFPVFPPNFPLPFPILISPFILILFLSFFLCISLSFLHVRIYSLIFFSAFILPMFVRTMSPILTIHSSLWLHHGRRSTAAGDDPLGR